MVDFDNQYVELVSFVALSKDEVHFINPNDGKFYVKTSEEVLTVNGEPKNCINLKTGELFHLFPDQLVIIPNDVDITYN